MSHAAHHEPLSMPPLLTVKQVAQMLNVSISKVYVLRDQGRLPWTRVGGSTRFYEPDVRDYILRNMVGDSSLAAKQHVQRPRHRKGDSDASEEAPSRPDVP